MPCTPGGTTSPPVAPILTTLVPNTAPIGCPDMITERLLGSNFTASTIVTLNGVPTATTFVNSTELNFTLNPPTAATGVIQVGAQTGSLIAAPTIPFTWTAAVASTLISLVPSSAVIGAAEPDLMVTVNGLCFLSTSQVLMDGTPVTVLKHMRAYVSSTSMTFIAKPSLELTPRTAQITVETGGLPSNALPFNFVTTLILPIITCPVVPASVIVGTPNTTVVTVNGQNFTNTCEVLLNGIAQVTTFVSATVLTFVAQSLAATAGIVQVTVRDTTGSSVTSCPFEFISAVLPIVIELVPPCVELTGSAQTIRVLGQNFLPTSVVQFDGVAQTTIYSSATELRVNVQPAAMLAHQGIHQVTVSNSGILSTPTVPLTYYATPTLTTVFPDFIPTHNTALQEITLTGTNFVPESIVYYYGTALPTRYVSATELKADRDPGAVGNESGPITVRHCLGIVSNDVGVNSNANPTLNSLSVTTLPSGGAPVTVKVYAENAGAGTNSQVLVNGTLVPTVMDGHIPTFQASRATAGIDQISVRSHVGNGDADVVFAPLTLPLTYT